MSSRAVNYLLIFPLALATCCPVPGVAGDTIPKPLFADPHYHGSCDPEVVWNANTREWWVFYTARRAKRESGTYVGTPIGVTASSDLLNWRFLGYASFDGVEGEPDMPVTYWAPGMIRDGDTYHMFVTHKPNAKPPWGGKGDIVHYTAPADNLLHGWVRAGVPALEGKDPIDAGLTRLKDNRWLMVYRSSGPPKISGISYAVSNDLNQWDTQGLIKLEDGKTFNRAAFGYHEAPYVFEFDGFYWMLTDPHQGLGVLRSEDGLTWTPQSNILKEPGKSKMDGTRARHPSVAVIGERAFVFYHVEPNRPYPSPKAEDRTIEQKISVLQMAELHVIDGRLVCNRDVPVVAPSADEFLIKVMRNE